jgi:hypothetical protein
MDILNAVKGDVAVTWPGPTKDDLALIGAIIVQFSYLDFYLRRAIEVLDHAKMGPEKWRGRTGKMPMGEVEAFMRSMRDMTPQNQLAFDDMKEMRKVRNLLAHFAVRRFPTEDAFVLVTKDERDFERILGHKPASGAAMTNVLDADQLRRMVKPLDNLAAWVAKSDGRVVRRDQPGRRPEIVDRPGEAEPRAHRHRRAGTVFRRNFLAVRELNDEALEALVVQRLPHGIAYADTENHVLLALELVREHADRPCVAARRVAAHDIALDEQLLLLLRGCRADTAENRHRQCNSAQRPGIR